MKPDEQLVEMDEAHDNYAVPADWFIQENGYLPPPGDQSWREQEAMRIVPAHEKFGEVETANDDPAAPEQFPDSEPGGRGLKSVIFALLTVPVIAVAIVALTSPGILSAAFRHTHRAEASSNSNSAGTGVSAARSPTPGPPAEAAPPQVRLAPVTAPDSITASAAPVTPPKSPPAPSIEPNSATAAVANTPAAPARLAERETPPPSQPVPASGPDLNAVPPARSTPDRNKIPEAAARSAPGPAPRLARRYRTHDQGRNGFYVKVIQPDGTLRNQYFASKSKPASPPSTAATGRDEANRRGAGGFYAMVAEPDGTLEYRYFPSSPPR